MTKRKQRTHKKKAASASRRKKLTPTIKKKLNVLSVSSKKTLQRGSILFALGIFFGLGIGLVTMMFASPFLMNPTHSAVVAEAPANEKEIPSKNKIAETHILAEKTTADSKPEPSQIVSLAKPTIPKDPLPGAEEGVHQSAPTTILPIEQHVTAAEGLQDTTESTHPMWLQNSVAMRKFSNQPMIAIVLDDVGVAPQHAELAIDLPAPIVLSIMTYANNAETLAQKARANGHEIMVHMPMQPISDAINPGPNALTVGMSSEELKRRVDWGLGRFKGYVGFNNHMGSRFTQDAVGMRVVLEEAKRRGLLFLDSKTIADSVGDKLAKEMGVTHIARDVFLDDDMSETAVSRQLSAAEAVARRQGYAVAIGHPHPATISVLKRWLPEVKARGFVIVPLTTIVKKREGVTG